MKTSPQIVQVHRFGEYVAINLGAETKYILHNNARELAEAINAVTTDIAEHSSDPRVGTFRATFQIKGR